MQLQLGQIRIFVISSPEIAKEVLRTHDANFASRPWRSVADTVFYNSTDIAGAPYGEYWRQVRKICVLELLTAKRVLSFRGIREEEVSKFVKCIAREADESATAAGSSVINLSKLLFSLTYSITSRAAFGEIREEQQEFVKFVEDIAEEASRLGLADLFPSNKLLQKMSSMGSRLKRLHQQADKILENIIKDHRDGERLGKIGDGVPYDLVDVLLKVQKGTDLGFPLTTDNIKALILDVFTAGSETSSTAVEWAMSELMKHPSVMEKAQAELRQVFGAKGEVEEACLHQLNYLKLVIKETVRLHPPAPLLLPRASLQECKVNGYQLPANSSVVVNGWALGRDPNYWGEPESFKPERFGDGKLDYKGLDFEYIPFGAGRRICPGIAFGMANIELPLASLLYHFDWKLPIGMEPESLDMDENLGATCGRKNPLKIIPVLHHP